MDRIILKEVILDQRTRKLPRDVIARELEKNIGKLKKTSHIIIISGIRRCGKSTFMEMLRLKNKEADYYLNFDDDRLVDFSVNDFKDLAEVFMELFGEQSTYYFDEIQNIPMWERFVRRLYDEGKKIYITGSNASMLSRELGTHLTGRYIEKRLFPFSFSEFLKFEGIDYDKKLNLTSAEKAKLKRSFNKYMELGGFPSYIKDKNSDILKFLYEGVIYRDIIVRYNIPREKPLKELVYFCASNIGKEISFNSLKKIIGINSSTSVKEYFDHLENSFLVFLLPRFDFSLKRQIYLNKKVYFIDTALAKNIGFRFFDDFGRILENIVFLELKRQNKELYYHKKNKECDFLIKDKNKIVSAIQVAKNIKDKKIKDREISGLLEATTEHKLKKGLILTEYDEGLEKVDGVIIEIKPVYKWLLENNQ